MKPIPLLDYVGSPILCGLFALLLFLQWKCPLRRRHFSAAARLVRNFVMSVPAFVVLRLALVPIPFAHTFWAQRNGIGLLNWIRLPSFLAAIVAFLLMDWAYYWWHYATHRLPILWRFHNVHHTDLDLDVSTAARFHFGEILLSIPFRLLVVVLLGIPPLVYLVFEIAFESASVFHHSNWRLSLGLERLLNHVIVTPRMHGIHHSIVERETDSNWGTIFCWWDKLHRSLRRDIPQAEITIGVAAFREEEELTVGKLLSLPFREQRPWRLPTGEVPEREPRPAEKLQP
ncbi:MAG TPA: sterol desaturase family protein [Chthoniobacterales bacterium]|jgi:sterol desaturase/sphingolipid hydroxylase (fatty acid hydroxylase superfamily)